jgi:DNA glycosylase AlkZ-like
MQLSTRQLNRTTLQRQLLLQRARVDVVDAVRHLVGLQAQQPAAPYLALWNRVADFDPTDLDAAFAGHRVVKASLLRITLHAVAVEDRPVWHRAVLPALRGSRLYDRRFTGTGQTAADADGIVDDLLELLAEPRTNAEVEAWLAQRFPDVPDSRVWWALRTYAPLIHAPGPHPWAYGPRPSYRAAPVVRYDGERTDAMLVLARRYLAAYGPATAADLAGFATLERAPATAAIGALKESGELVEHTGPDGKPILDLAEGSIADEDVVAPPRLLGMWDNVLLAHTDRSRLIPPDYRATVIRRNGDVLPMLLVDGQVAGVWRLVERGIEATAFRRLPATAWDGLAGEADMLRSLVVEREPRVFSRYDHWWKRIDGAQTKVI